MKQHFDVTINDVEFDIVARTTMLLLLALTLQDSTHDERSNAPLTTAEILIHLWYSASIPAYVLSMLEQKVKPLIVMVCSKIADKLPSTILGKTWAFSSGRTLRLVLTQAHWLRLAKFMSVPANLNIEDAAAIRRAVALAAERLDYRDRWYFKDASPWMRIARRRFQEDGLLLPFGHPRAGFDTPNP